MLPSLPPPGGRVFFLNQFFFGGILFFMFQQLYQVLSTFLFNGSPASWAYGELICQGFAGAMSVFLVSLPFLLVWRFIRTFL